jgi:hypothetical protein
MSSSDFDVAFMTPVLIYGAQGPNLAVAPREAPGSLFRALGGVTATLTDARRNVFPVGLFYVSPNQVTCLIPKGAASGVATIALSNGSATFAGTAMIGPDGTGIRGGAQANVSVRIGNVDAPVTYAGPQGHLSGSRPSECRSALHS